MKKYIKPTVNTIESSSTLLTASCGQCTCGCNHKPGIGGCANCPKCNNDYDGYQEYDTGETFPNIR